MVPRGTVCRLLLVAFVLLVPGTTLSGQVLPLDHFKVYEVDPVLASFPVRLTGQFETTGIDANLLVIDHFANPTEKVLGPNVTLIADPNRHLDWYVLNQWVIEPVRTIRYRNQLGLQSIDIHNPRYLLVPAQKVSDPGSVFPQKADHYKCYEVIRVNFLPLFPPISLKDQFGPQTGVNVFLPRYFCVPVKKERPGFKPVGIFNPIDHLTVYDITPQAIDRQIATRDQFGQRGLHVNRSVWLAVPTEKLAVVVH
jgi:hypothetical protein